MKTERAAKVVILTLSTTVVVLNSRQPPLWSTIAITRCIEAKSHLISVPQSYSKEEEGCDRMEMSSAYTTLLQQSKRSRRKKATV